MDDFDAFKNLAKRRLLNDGNAFHKEFESLLVKAGYDSQPLELRPSILSAATLKVAESHTLAILEEYHSWLMQNLQR